MKWNAIKTAAISIALLAMCNSGGAQNFGPWQAPVNLGPVINSPCNDMHPALSKDGLTLIFSSNRPYDHVATGPTDCLPALHLWGTQRDSPDSPWPAPQLLPINLPANSPYEDHAANLTTDEHWLLFYSRRPGDEQNPSCNGGGYQELWASHRHGKNDLLGWETPINLGCTLNVPFADDGGPNLFEDPETGTLYLYFARDLTPLGPGTDPSGNGFNIYVSTCTFDLSSCLVQQLWNPAVLETNLNTPARDAKTAIRHRDGLEMLLTSSRPGTLGGLDLWVSTRSSVQDPWSIPINLNTDNVDKGGDPDLNTSANDGGADFSWDATTLVFYSGKPGGFGGNDLYMSTRQNLTGAN